MVSCFSHVQPFVTLWTTRVIQAPLSKGFCGVGCHALLQGIFKELTWGLNPCLLMCWQVGSLPLALPGKSCNQTKLPLRVLYFKITDFCGLTSNKL